MAKLTDAELFEAGRRARGRGQCGSVIVATDGQGERNYHNCDGDASHLDSLKHGCGCGQEWTLVSGVQVWTGGPLTDVVHAP